VDERVIDAEVVEERIVACPQCSRKNRLYRRRDAGVYRCGACHASLANPFTTRSATRTTAYVTAAVLAALVIIVIVAGLSQPRSPAEQAATPKAAERDSRKDKLLSQTDPSGLPPISIARNRATSNPQSPPQPVVTTVPVNNQIIVDAYPQSTSKGELRIDNGTDYHAIVKVIDRMTDRKILSFVVCAHQKSHITAIPDGEYDLIFAFGDRLFEGTDRFHSPHGFSKFVKPITFTMRVTEEAIYWDQLSLTLHPVFDGKAKTTSISQKDFERY
jgi:ribosomal protein L37AE/L43A